MKYGLLLILAVALIGCGKKAEPDEKPQNCQQVTVIAIDETRATTVVENDKRTRWVATGILGKLGESFQICYGK